MSIATRHNLIPWHSLGSLINWVARKLTFKSSADYWESRYARGGNSGAGSYGRLAAYKAEFLNGFVARENIHSVVEFGCGDGNQLSLSEYPTYLGLDVAETAIHSCRQRFADDSTKSFRCIRDGAHSPDDVRRELAISLDVIYHLVENDAFHRYLTNLFDSAERFVIVYSSNDDLIPASPHVRHRVFTDWVSEHRPEWTLIQHLPNPYPYDRKHHDTTSFADFFVFQRSA